MRCLGILCKSCDSEKSQTLKAASAASQIPNVKSLNTVFIPSSPIDYLYTYDIFKGFDSIYTYEAIPSPPVYLKNLSILC